MSINLSKEKISKLQHWISRKKSRKSPMPATEEGSSPNFGAQTKGSFQLEKDTSLKWLSEINEIIFKDYPSKKVKPCCIMVNSKTVLIQKAQSLIWSLILHLREEGEFSLAITLFILFLSNNQNGLQEILLFSASRFPSPSSSLPSSSSSDPTCLPLVKDNSREEDTEPDNSSNMLYQALETDIEKPVGEPGKLSEYCSKLFHDGCVELHHLQLALYIKTCPLSVSLLIVQSWIDNKTPLVWNSVEIVERITLWVMQRMVVDKDTNIETIPEIQKPISIYREPMNEPMNNTSKSLLQIIFDLPAFGVTERIIKTALDLKDPALLETILNHRTCRFVACDGEFCALLEWEKGVIFKVPSLFPALHPFFSHFLVPHLNSPCHKSHYAMLLDRVQPFLGNIYSVVSRSLYKTTSCIPIIPSTSNVGHDCTDDKVIPESDGEICTDEKVIPESDGEIVSETDSKANELDSTLVSKKDTEMIRLLLHHLNYRSGEQLLSLLRLILSSYPDNNFMYVKRLLDTIIWPWIDESPSIRIICLWKAFLGLGASKINHSRHLLLLHELLLEIRARILDRDTNLLADCLYGALIHFQGQPKILPTVLETIVTWQWNSSSSSLPYFRIYHFLYENILVWFQRHGKQRPDEKSGNPDHPRPELYFDEEEGSDLMQQQPVKKFKEFVDGPSGLVQSRNDQIDIPAIENKTNSNETSTLMLEDICKYVETLVDRLENIVCQFNVTECRMLVLLGVSMGLDLDPFLILPVKQMLLLSSKTGTKKETRPMQQLKEQVKEMPQRTQNSDATCNDESDPKSSENEEEDDPYSWFTGALLPALANTLHYNRQDRLKLYSLFSTSKIDPFITN